MANRLLVGLCASTAIALCTPAFGVNKCTSPTGAVTFQDAPCAGQGQQLTVRPASGATPAAGAASANGAKPQTEAQRLENLVQQSQRERRKWELENVALPQTQSALDGHRRACEKKQKELAASQYAYQQNLYGKTHAAQIAAEMAASASQCDMKDRELNKQLEVLTKECSDLGCRK